MDEHETVESLEDHEMVESLEEHETVESLQEHEKGEAEGLQDRVETGGQWDRGEVERKEEIRKNWKRKISVISFSLSIYTTMKEPIIVPPSSYTYKILEFLLSLQSCLFSANSCGQCLYKIPELCQTRRCKYLYSSALQKDTCLQLFRGFFILL